jgi:hypothetical protein
MKVKKPPLKKVKDAVQRAFMYYGDEITTEDIVNVIQDVWEEENK